MNPIRLFAALAASLCIASPILAASLTITNIAGAWSSSSPTVEGLGSTEIRWGDPAETQRSGYNFSFTPTPFTVEDQTRFVIGVFTHENFPVFGNFLQSANLSVQFNVHGLRHPITSTFAFLHQETLNNISGTCANGEMSRVGVNKSGCADRVKANLNRNQSDSFFTSGMTYVLDIMGFQKDGTRLTSFWTKEDFSNSAELVAIFRVQDGELLPEVPAPASGILILAGISALAFARRRL